ncbi:MAG: D-alanine--D-alanine ligase [candidate division Zixibacteria bacterium]|nr:D-alanine--D-alanine ligase [candidate division Zixibacteria bacterium]
MKILLLAGGGSGEREVSLTSGKAVCDALLRLGHTVRAIDPATGKSLLGDDSIFAAFPLDTNAANSQELVPLTLAGALESPDLHNLDIVFVVLHGGAGENGSIQNLLELSGMKFTGSDMTASAVAMDKAISKRLFESQGILTPDWALYRLPTGRIDDALCRKITDQFSFPIIVKPNDSGSTIGLSKVDSADDLPAALKKALAHTSNILVETYITGREVTVSVLDGRAFPVVEIKPANELYDYEAKYTEGKSEYIVPAKIPAATATQLQETAGRVFDIIGASGLARVDFILAEDDRFYCLELNTVPGMTNLSLAPMAAKAAGIEFDRLMNMVIDSGMRRPIRT